MAENRRTGRYIMKSLCIFCGSSPGQGEHYLTAARQLGQLLAQRGITLVYGGGSIGLMGAAANACMAAGGQVIGIIPRHLQRKEVGNPDLTTLHVVDSMHERKAMMADLSDGFIVLPGGIGTLEEFFEVWTWGQLGIHGKPFGVLDVGGYYQGLFSFLDGMVEQGFLKPAHRAMVRTATDPQSLLDALAGYVAPHGDKWLEMTES